MDNEAYLQHIAAQASPVPVRRFVLTPVMIKILIGGAIALAMVIVLGAIVNSVNRGTVGMYERYYLRVSALSKAKGPLDTYSKVLRSSDLRSMALVLQSSLIDTTQNLSGILADLKVDKNEISEEASSAESGVMGGYTSELSTAKLNGLLDRQFVTATTLQISLLLSMESEIREKTGNTSLKGLVDKSTADLEVLLKQFQDYGDTH